MENIIKTHWFGLIATYAVFFTVAGCSPAHKLYKLEKNNPNLFKTSTKDTTSSSISYQTRDSIIYIPGKTLTQTDTLVSTVTEPCPQHFTRTSSTGGQSATVTLNKGILTVICHDDSLKNQISIRDKTITTLKQEVVTTLAQSRPQYLTHWYDHLCRGIVAIGLICLLVFVGLKALKPKL